MAKSIKYLLGLLIVTAMLSQPAYAAKEPLRLAASSKWVAEYSEDSCRLIRQFGEGNDKVTVIFSRYETGDGFSVALVGNPVKQTSSTNTVYLQFGPNESEQEHGFYAGKAGDQHSITLKKATRIASYTAEEEKLSKSSDNLDPPIKPLDIERYNAVSFIYIKQRGSQPVILETISLKEPFTAFTTCTDELMTHWGIDVEKHKNLSRKLNYASDPQKWLNSNDYPSNMLFQGQPALVNYRLSVDEYGKPTACHIQQTTRPKDFDDAVCKGIMRRATFTPALDADGSAIASYMVGSVNFQLPQ